MPAQRRRSGAHTIFGGLRRQGSDEDLARSHPGHFYEYMFGERLGDWHWDMYETLMWALANPSERTPYLVLAPRMFGKTSQLESYIAWRIGKDPNERVKVVCAKEETAADRVDQVAKVIRSKRFVELFGDLYPNGARGYAWRGDAIDVLNSRFDHMDEDEFLNTRRDNTLKALGMDGSAAGGRATCMVFDDIITETNSQTDQGRQSLARKFANEFLPIPYLGAPIIILGTRYHEEDLYAQLIQQYDTEKRYVSYYPPAVPHLPEIELSEASIDDVGDAGGGTVRIYPAYDDTGKLLWPDRPQPGMTADMGLDEKVDMNWKWLMARKKAHAVSPGTFQAQYLLDPSYLSGAQYSMDWLHYYGGLDLPPMADLTGYMGIDPATSESGESCYTGICVAALDASSERVYVLGFSYGHWKATTHMEQFLSEHKRWTREGLNIALVQYETTGPIQGAFDHIERDLRQGRHNINFSAVKAKGTKPERFDQLATWIREGLVVFPGQTRADGKMELLPNLGFDEFRREFTRFNGKKSGSRTDLLDALYISVNTALELPEAEVLFSSRSALEGGASLDHRDEINRLALEYARDEGDVARRRRLEAEREDIEMERRGYVNGFDPEYAAEGYGADGAFGSVGRFRQDMMRGVMRRARARRF